ncbi:MAG: ferritin family protein [Nitrospirae bacterium]|nr:ferritin family protein [Nitrospirota bacterium]
METFSIREVIEMAVRTEVLGNSYYNDLAAKFKGGNREVYELFTKLAEAEKNHIIAFTALKEKVGEEEPDNWQDISEYMRAFVESAFFLGKDKAMLHMQNVADPLHAVGLAIGFEKETLLYFYTIRDSVKEKNIVNEIIEEEKHHIVWLSKYKAQHSGHNA